MINKIKSKIKAFSLIELSIVTLIISLLLTGAISVSKIATRNANIKITQDKITAINRAMSRFLAIYKRLPCPADITLLSTAATFGQEATAKGACSTGAIPSTMTNVNLVYGTIPTTTLGIPKEMASDGFGTKFSYYVDKRFTIESSGPSDTAGFEITAGTPQGNTVLNGGSNPALLINAKEVVTSGNLIYSNIGVMAIISHGPNKLGGYSYNGASQNTLPNSSSSEYDNVYISAATMDNIFTSNTYNLTYEFDDIVSYKTKAQLIRDAGLQFIICSTNESSISSNGHTVTWSNSVSYGNSTTNDNGACTTPAPGNLNRSCGQYGIWGTIGCTT